MVHHFLGQFTGVVYYDVKPVQAELHLDACLTGFGGICDKQCYALPIPKDKNYYSIINLEMLNIVVALKIAGSQWQATNSYHQLSHLRPGRELNPGLRGGRRVLPLCHCGPLVVHISV